MTNPDDESNELKAFGGWLLFGVLGALAVIGAFLTIGNNDDADHTPITAPDAVETGAAGTVDFDAVIAAMAAAGVETPSAVATGADRIRVGGTLPSEALRRAAVAAARAEVDASIAVDTAFSVAAQVAEAPEADEEATDE